MAIRASVALAVLCVGFCEKQKKAEQPEKPNCPTCNVCAGATCPKPPEGRPPGELEQPIVTAKDPVAPDTLGDAVPVYVKLAALPDISAGELAAGKVEIRLTAVNDELAERRLVMPFDTERQSVFMVPPIDWFVDVEATFGSRKLGAIAFLDTGTVERQFHTLLIKPESETRLATLMDPEINPQCGSKSPFYGPGWYLDELFLRADAACASILACQFKDPTGRGWYATSKIDPNAATFLVSATCQSIVESSLTEEDFFKDVPPLPHYSDPIPVDRKIVAALGFGPEGDESSERYLLDFRGNPTVLQTASGALFVLVIQGHEVGTTYGHVNVAGRLGVAISVDGGATWTGQDILAKDSPFLQNGDWAPSVLCGNSTDYPDAASEEKRHIEREYFFGPFIGPPEDSITLLHVSEKNDLTRQHNNCTAASLSDRWNYAEQVGYKVERITIASSGTKTSTVVDSGAISDAYTSDDSGKPVPEEDWIRRPVFQVRSNQIGNATILCRKAPRALQVIKVDFGADRISLLDTAPLDYTGGWMKNCLELPFPMDPIFSNQAGDLLTIRGKTLLRLDDLKGTPIQTLTLENDFISAGVQIQHQVDDDGNVHISAERQYAFVSVEDLGGTRRPRKALLFYVDSCGSKSCDALRAFLKQHGVEVEENPSDVPDALAPDAALRLARANSGDALLFAQDREGAYHSFAVAGGIDKLALARTLGFSFSLQNSPYGGFGLRDDGTPEFAAAGFVQFYSVPSPADEAAVNFSPEVVWKHESVVGGLAGYSVLPEHRPGSGTCGNTAILNSPDFSLSGTSGRSMPSLSVVSAGQPSAICAQARGWADKGAGFFDPDRDQGAVGSCHAFATVGMAESALFREYFKPARGPRLSEEHLFVKGTLQNLENRLKEESFYQMVLRIYWSGRRSRNLAPNEYKSGFFEGLPVAGDVQAIVVGGIGLGDAASYRSFAPRYTEFRDKQFRNAFWAAYKKYIVPLDLKSPDDNRILRDRISYGLVPDLLRRAWTPEKRERIIAYTLGGKNPAKQKALLDQLNAEAEVVKAGFDPSLSGEAGSQPAFYLTSRNFPSGPWPPEELKVEFQAVVKSNRSVDAVKAFHKKCRAFAKANKIDVYLRQELENARPVALSMYLDGLPWVDLTERDSTHAVVATGFKVLPKEKTGGNVTTGVFRIRNSWGSSWCSPNVTRSYIDFPNLNECEIPLEEACRIFSIDSITGPSEGKGKSQIDQASRTQKRKALAEAMAGHK